MPRGLHGSGPRDHPAEGVTELREATGAELLSVACLDVGHDFVATSQLLETSRRRDDQLRPPIGRVGTALDVLELLELVDQPADDLLVAAGEPRQLGGADPVLVEVRQDYPVSRMEIVVPVLGEASEELLLQREGELACEHPEVGIPLLTFAAASGSSHKFR
jgi:hypothetical protein